MANKAGAVLGAALLMAGTIEANAAPDCHSVDPARERAALGAFLKKNGYSAKQVSFSLRYLDGKAGAWRKLPLTERGKQCGVSAIGGLIYGCVPEALPDLLKTKALDLNKPVTDPNALATLGVKKGITAGEVLVIGVASACQAEAIRTFADPRSW